MVAKSLKDKSEYILKEFLNLERDVIGVSFDNKSLQAVIKTSKGEKIKVNGILASKLKEHPTR